MTRRWLSFVGIIALVVFSVTGVAAAPPNGGPPGLDQALAAQARHTERLMGNPNVAGTAVGVNARGQAAVLVFTKSAGVAGLPADLDGVPVEVVVTGEITALGGPAPQETARGGATTLRPTSRWPRPVPIGVSTGNRGECSAGTIGARVKDSLGNVYALSNNHVYALENSAAIGSELLQPGLYDTSCVYDANNGLGTLANFVPIDFSGADNTVDVAIGASSLANLGNATPSDGYGVPMSATVAAQLNQAVQKYGRTTKLTKGSVVGINATVNVGYSTGTAKFVGQIVVLGTKPFSKAGDSGSLVVTNSGRNPVGLLFAGSATGYTFLNPINAVLAAVGVTVDGQ